ncbi:MAG: LPS export ABC transporter periplasmic protein LptC [Candidatus Krumholzibacteria bacterium]|nr:LPS export ABC transporter periplasmic protein LptC [Candidatus Krumholzibacteria bacterium]MDH4336515.1 LPS export ABC transporter periplasmic protein LptC [Candidatus Krumholzibacteria bacterium]MDH5269596.1 LPS export ABC transporter periplasmic protein LptC [Candidatus Krumholzibacteria bacterium]MDH5628146.1 LPS export ABC transporter periplasmic protein LptC [Candidatus Krumholzibacteria bacterium]
MRRRRKARWLLGVLAVAVALAACDRKEEQDAAVRDPAIPDETVTDFATQESDSGRVQWTLRAPHANRFNARNVFVMDDPRIEFYDKLGNLQTTLTADKGEYLLDSHDMLAYGNVVAVSFKGEVLETDSLRYLNEADMIVSDSFVKLTRGRDVVTGIGLECDHTLDSVVIKKDVHAVVREEDGKFNQ